MATQFPKFFLNVPDGDLRSQVCHAMLFKKLTSSFYSGSKCYIAKPLQAVGKKESFFTTAFEDYSQFTVCTTQAIENYFASYLGIAYTSDIRKVALQSQIRNQISELLELAIKLYESPADKRNDAEDEFKIYAKDFIYAHQNIICINGAETSYFGGGIIYTDIALAVTIKAIERMLATRSPLSVKIIGREGAPKIHILVNKICTDVNFKVFFKKFDIFLKIYYPAKVSEPAGAVKTEFSAKPGCEP